MFRIFVAFLFFVSFAQAQEGTRIKTKLFTFALGELPSGFKAFFKTGEEILEFSAGEGGLSAPINYAGPPVFVLRESREAFSAPPKGQDPQPPLAWVNLPLNADNILVIATLTEDGKIRLLAYNISTRELAPGDYKFFNFSTNTLSFIFDSQKFTMAPGTDRLVKDPEWQRAGKGFTNKIAIVDANNKAKLAYSSLWEHYPAGRSLMLVFNGNRPSQKVTFRVFNVETPTESTAEQ